MATTLGPAGSRASTATAVTAAVRSSVIQVPSITARVCPVAGSIRTIVAIRVGSPRAGLSGNRVMSLVPSALAVRAGFMNSMPFWAGMSKTLRSG
jgi:hypothetical protein